MLTWELHINWCKAFEERTFLKSLNMLTPILFILIFIFFSYSSSEVAQSNVYILISHICCCCCSCILTTRSQISSMKWETRFGFLFFVSYDYCISNLFQSVSCCSNWYFLCGATTAVQTIFVYKYFFFYSKFSRCSISINSKAKPILKALQLLILIRFPCKTISIASCRVLTSDTLFIIM